MPGDMGPYLVVEGQVTADGEMIMAQLQALFEMQEGKIELQILSKWYSFFMQSEPYGLG
jgi:hypothetical protein